MRVDICVNIYKCDEVAKELQPSADRKEKVEVYNVERRWKKEE